MLNVFGYEMIIKTPQKYNQLIIRLLQKRIKTFPYTQIIIFKKEANLREKMYICLREKAVFFV